MLYAFAVVTWHTIRTALLQTAPFECLDTDPMVDTGKQISHVQARALFARACGKVERGISGLDEHDIMQRVGARDMVACARAGRVFFAYALGGALLSTYAV